MPTKVSARFNQLLLPESWGTCTGIHRKIVGTIKDKYNLGLGEFTDMGELNRDSGFNVLA